MIYNLIGSGILVAVGAAGMWAWMRARVEMHRASVTSAIIFAARYLVERDDALDELATEKQLHRLMVGDWQKEKARAERLSDTVGQLQEKRDRALDCVTPSSAHVGKKMAAILTGER